MEKHALLYIVTPIVLVFIVYLLIITVTWPVVRNRSFVPFYLLFFLLIFPPGFFFFLFWFYLIHLGFLSSRYYVYDLEERRPPTQRITTTTTTTTKTRPQKQTQRQQRSQSAPRGSFRV